MKLFTREGDLRGRLLIASAGGVVDVTPQLRDVGPARSTCGTGLGGVHNLG